MLGSATASVISGPQHTGKVAKNCTSMMHCMFDPGAKIKLESTGKHWSVNLPSLHVTWSFHPLGALHLCGRALILHILCRPISSMCVSLSAFQYWHF
jgi:hypothetical protein